MKCLEAKVGRLQPLCLELGQPAVLDYRDRAHVRVDLSGTGGEMDLGGACDSNWIVRASSASSR